MVSVRTSASSIGVIADVHDNLDNLQTAFLAFRDRGIDVVLMAGDFCSPIVASEMIQFPGVVHAVFGNGDGDRWKMEHIASQSAGRLQLHGEYVELEIERRRIVMSHYEFYAEALARTNRYDLAIAGHTHVRKAESVASCLLLNPGEVMGWKKHPSCAVYHLHDCLSEFVELA